MGWTADIRIELTWPANELLGQQVGTLYETFLKPPLDYREEYFADRNNLDGCEFLVQSWNKSFDDAVSEMVLPLLELNPNITVYICYQHSSGETTFTWFGKNAELEKAKNRQVDLQLIEGELRELSKEHQGIQLGLKRHFESIDRLLEDLKGKLNGKL